MLIPTICSEFVFVITRSEINCDIPNIVPVGIGHRGASSAPVIERSIDIGNSESVHTAHVYLEGDGISLCNQKVANNNKKQSR